jgi:hypothetical protein
MSTSDVTTQAILATYKRLPAEERRKIDRLVETARSHVPRPSSGGKGLGKQAALELIGKLGIFLDKHTPVARSAETPVAVVPNAVDQRGPSHRGRRRTKHV